MANKIDLISKVRSGDQKAIKELMKTTRLHVLNMARSCVNNDDDALLVAQQSYEDLILGKAKVDDVCKYLNKRVIANANKLKNNKLDFNLKHKAKKSIDLDKVDINNAKDCLNNPYLERVIYETFDKLNDEEKAVVMPIYYSSNSVEDVAKELKQDKKTIQDYLDVANEKIDKTFQKLCKKYKLGNLVNSKVYNASFIYSVVKLGYSIVTLDVVGLSVDLIGDSKKPSAIGINKIKEDNPLDVTLKIFVRAVFKDLVKDFFIGRAQSVVTGAFSGIAIGGTTLSSGASAGGASSGATTVGLSSTAATGATSGAATVSLSSTAATSGAVGATTVGTTSIAGTVGVTTAGAGATIASTTVIGTAVASGAIASGVAAATTAAATTAAVASGAAIATGAGIATAGSAIVTGAISVGIAAATIAGGVVAEEIITPEKNEPIKHEEQVEITCEALYANSPFTILIYSNDDVNVTSIDLHGRLDNEVFGYLTDADLEFINSIEGLEIEYQKDIPNNYHSIIDVHVDKTKINPEIFEGLKGFVGDQYEFIDDVGEMINYDVDELYNYLVEQTYKVNRN